MTLSMELTTFLRRITHRYHTALGGTYYGWLTGKTMGTGDLTYHEFRYLLFDDEFANSMITWLTAPELSLEEVDIDLRQVAVLDRTTMSTLLGPATQSFTQADGTVITRHTVLSGNTTSFHCFLAPDEMVDLTFLLGPLVNDANDE